MNKIETSSVQLAIRGKASAFDINQTTDSLCISSPGCITFFDLKGLGLPSEVVELDSSSQGIVRSSSGNPKHVIHYEQPQQIRQIKYQQAGPTSLFGALRGGVVSIWDPMSILKPVKGFAAHSGWITNFDWHKPYFNQLGTCCENGEVRIWDLRSLNNSVQNISTFGRIEEFRWCPFDPNMFAISKQHSIQIFDIRILFPVRHSNPQSNSTSTYSQNGDGSIFKYERMDENLSFEWSLCKEQIIIHSHTQHRYDFIAVKNNVIEASIPLPFQQFSSASTSSTAPPDEVPEVTTLTSFLPTPLPHTVVTSLTSLTRLAVEPDDNFNATDTSDSPQLQQDVDSSTEDLVGGKSPRFPFPFPPKSPLHSHMTAFVASLASPHPAVTTRLWLQHSSGQEEGGGGGGLEHQMDQLAICAEPILGMRWGGAATFSTLPSNIDLYFLTSSAALHSLRVPLEPPARKHPIGRRHGGLMERPPESIGLSLDESNHSVRGGAIRSARPPVSPTRASLKAVQHPLSALRPSLATTETQSTQSSVSAPSGIFDTFTQSRVTDGVTAGVTDGDMDGLGYGDSSTMGVFMDADDDVDTPPVTTSSAAPSGASPEGNSRRTVSIRDAHELALGQEAAFAVAYNQDVWTVLEPELLQLQNKIDEGLYQNVSFTQDKYARQITIDSTRPTAGPFAPLPLTSTTSTAIDTTSAAPLPATGAAIGGSAGASAVVSLIVSCPPSGRPSFLLRGDISDCRSTLTEPPLDIRALNAELTDLTRRLLDTSANPISKMPLTPQPASASLWGISGRGEGLLLSLVACFHKRVCQKWGVKAPAASIPLLPLPTVGQEPSGASQIRSTSSEWEGEGRTRAGEDDLAMAIEQKAYKIPCPATSGASFSSSGVLLCWGAVQFANPINHMEGNSVHSDNLPNSKAIPRVFSRASWETFPSLRALPTALSQGFPTNLSDSMMNPSAGGLGVAAEPTVREYPKTYADMLVRIRDEQYAARSSARERLLKGVGIGSGSVGGGGGLYNGGYDEVRSIASGTKSFRDAATVESDYDFRSRDGSVGNSVHGSSLLDKRTGSFQTSSMYPSLTSAPPTSTMAFGLPQGADPAGSFPRRPSVSSTDAPSQDRSAVDGGRGWEGAEGRESRSRGASDAKPSWSLLNQGDFIMEIGRDLDSLPQVYLNQLGAGREATMIRVYSGISSALITSQRLAEEYCLGPMPLLCQFSAVSKTVPSSKSSLVPLKDVASASWEALLGFWRQQRAEEAGDTRYSNFKKSTNASVRNLMALLREEVELVEQKTALRNRQHADDVKSTNGVINKPFTGTGEPDAKGQGRSNIVIKDAVAVTGKGVLPVSQPVRVGDKSGKGNPYQFPGVEGSTGLLRIEALCRAHVCRYNGQLCKDCGQQSLARMWELLAVSFDVMALPAVSGLCLSSWRDHALGLKLVERIINHLRTSYSLVTMAAVICVLGGSEAAADLLRNPHPRATNAFSSLSFDLILLSYADVLRRWGLSLQATETTKFVSNCIGRGKESERVSVYLSTAHSDSTSPRDLLDSSLYKQHIPRYTGQIMPKLKCIICEDTLRRETGYYCVSCGHGGHPKHLKLWFSRNTECPTGCRCLCGSFGSQRDFRNGFSPGGGGGGGGGGDDGRDLEYETDDNVSSEGKGASNRQKRGFLKNFANYQSSGAMMRSDL